MALVPETDPANREHYRAKGLECLEAIKAATEGLEGYAGYLTGQCFKYLWRWDHKGQPIEDLQKCEWYLKRLIEYTQESEGHGSQSRTDSRTA